MIRLYRLLCHLLVLTNHIAFCFDFIRQTIWPGPDGELKKPTSCGLVTFTGIPQLSAIKAPAHGGNALMERNRKELTAYAGQAVKQPGQVKPNQIPGRWKQTTFGSVISCNENFSPSRPRPEYLTPPKGIESRR